MATADAGPEFVREHTRAVTAIVSVVGYAVVIGAFAGLIPIPDISRSLVVLLSDLIAVINTLALTSLVAGYWFIRNRQIRRHRAAMLTAFGLIMLFLVVYVTKVGGGFEKSIRIEQGQFLATYAGLVEPAYLAMLVVHILLSVVSVPVVLYAVILGLTRTPTELAETNHARYGRVAVAAWTVSLALGILTYVMLNHVYSWDIVERGAMLLLLAAPATRQ
jgi:putative membrane protein